MHNRNCASALGFVVAMACAAAARADDASSWSYGGGHHGQWVLDDFGLPAYRYTGCAPDRLPCIPTEDAVHQLGNDGVNALAHSGGYVELYGARSYHRFANRYDESKNAFAGGFGWVRDGDETWSTLWADRPPTSRYERTFGAGYFEKVIEHRGLALEHWIYLTEGEDAVVREHLVFTNRSPERKTITYFDYWDVAWWLPRALEGQKSPSAYDPATVATRYDRPRGVLEALSEAAPGDVERPDLLNDPVPQASFVAYLEGAPDAFETVQSAFFGNGSRALPQSIARGRLRNGTQPTGLPNPDAVLATQKSFVLAPGEQRVLDIAFGLAPRGEQRAVVARARSGPAFALPRIAAKWRATMPRVSFPGVPWLGREMAWSYYYLRSGLLREDFFGARVLNQGSIYLYEWGTNAGPRSTFRHLLPFVYFEPALAKESLLYFLRAMKPNGDMPYSTSGHGAWNTQGFNPSDQTFWLLAAATEYLYATRDFGLLDERIDFWCEAGRGRCGSATVYEALVAAYRFAKYGVATGDHGLVRLLHSDWDDFLVRLAGDPVTTATRGESTMNTALALATYPAFASLAERRGDLATATSVRADVEALQGAMQAQWRGDHFNRGYTFAAPDAPQEMGASTLWVASNGIALQVPGLLQPDESHALAARIERDNLLPSPGGLAAIGSAVFERGTPGNWYSLTGPTVEGLLAHGERDLAWRTFLGQTLANHAATYPAYWYGIWTGPDMYFTPLDQLAGLGVAGSTWCFPSICMAHLPATNMFAHSEPLLGSLRVAGLRADARGAVLDPAVPGPFSWTSPSFGIVYGNEVALGWTRAIADDAPIYRVRIPPGLRGTPRVTVGGATVSASVEGGFAVFTVPLRRGAYASWVLR
jgi:hypothetical protein